MEKIILFDLVILLKAMHVWLPIKVGFEKCVIIDDVDNKSPFLSGIFKAGWSIIISYEERIYLNKCENTPAFFVWCD